MKKAFIIILAVLLCLPVFGCGLFLERHTNIPPNADTIGEDKVFYGDGYTITLTDDFAEKQSHQGFDGYYVSTFCGVMVKKEPFSLAERLKDESLADYMKNVIRNNNENTEPVEEVGLVYYRYYNGGNAGWNFGFKGSDAFYLVQFICREDHETALKNFIFSFAKSVKVD